MLALDPADRPATAAEVERQLRAWSADPDEIAEEASDEATILNGIPDTSEGTQVSLPEMEAVVEVPQTARWLWPAAGLLGLAGAALLALAAWLAMR